MLGGGNRRLGGTAAALAAAAALLAAGCAGDGDDEASPDGGTVANPVAEAAAMTLAAGTARVAYDAAFEGAEQSFTFTAEGGVDYAERRVRLVYDMEDLPGTGQEEVEVRFEGYDAFVHFPRGAQDVELPEGKEWVRVPPPEEGEEEEEEQTPQQEVDLAGVQQDPTQFLRYLESGATDVLEEGAEEVRGAQTTLYTANIDFDLVLAEGVEGLGDDDEGRAAARAQVEALRGQLGNVLPVTVNVDGEGLVRRILLSFDLRAGPRGQPVSALTTTEYFDFGAEVEVEPPPEAQVIDAADVE